MLKTQTIILDGKEVEVKKLPLGKYPELIKGLTELPKLMNGLSGMGNEALLAKLPELITTAHPDFMHIFSVTTNIPREEIENELGLDDAVKITMAVLEVNNYKEIYSLIKKAFAPPIQQKIAQQQATKAA